MTTRAAAIATQSGPTPPAGSQLSQPTHNLGGLMGNLTTLLQELVRFSNLLTFQVMRGTCLLKLNLSQFLHSPGMPELWRARLLIPFIPVKTKTSFVTGSEEQVRRCQTKIGDGKTVASQIALVKKSSQIALVTIRLTDFAGEKRLHDYGPNIE